MNLENCENPLWIRCDGARAGQLTTGKLDFAGAKGETEIESQGIKAARGGGRTAETVSVPECSRRSGFRVRELGNGAIARADSSHRAVGFFRSTGSQIETPDRCISE